MKSTRYNLDDVRYTAARSPLAIRALTYTADSVTPWFNPLDFPDISTSL